MNAPMPPGFSTEAVLSAANLESARRATAAGVPMIEALETECGLSPDAFAHALAHALHLEYAGMEVLHGMTPAFDVLPYADAMQRECVLTHCADGALALVFSDPFNEALRPWVEYRVRQPLHWMLAHRTEIAAYLARHEEGMRAMDGMLVEAKARDSDGDGSEDLSLQSISADTSPVVKLVHSTLYDALKIGASDIHLETAADGLAIKYRVDGVLSQVGSAAGLDTAEQVISRIKVMSELDISERRTPQDGRFRLSMRGRQIDFRVSIMPSIHGEDAVLRILDKQALTDEVRGLRLDLLKFDDDKLEVIRRLCSEPYGMFLVTGPTGSGKTTTLYAAISEINHGHDKIITIEDPVEYQLPGVLQIPVNEKKGLTFARGLRSILRHDPDKIMVGEIRDSETAQIAVQAALTGHLVFTTVHANNVFDVLGRFSHMGIDPYSFVAALNGILAQRLVRVNCPHCTVDEKPDALLLARSALAPEAAGYRFRAGRGCGQCRGTGFKGRRAIAEMLIFTDEIRELIATRAPVRQIKELAARQGTRLLRDAAIDLMRAGETSLTEINRVTLVA
jgi:general secretion pathway protein E